MRLGPEADRRTLCNLNFPNDSQATFSRVKFLVIYVSLSSDAFWFCFVFARRHVCTREGQGPQWALPRRSLSISAGREACGHMPGVFQVPGPGFELQSAVWARLPLSST